MKSTFNEIITFNDLSNSKQEQMVLSFIDMFIPDTLKTDPHVYHQIEKNLQENCTYLLSINIDTIPNPQKVKFAIEQEDEDLNKVLAGMFSVKGANE
jgi:hypothetical protein